MANVLKNAKKQQVLALGQLGWSLRRIFAELCERAFRRLGGCPQVIVLDSLREGVLEPDIYDPTLDPLFSDMLTHYGVAGMPCRVRDPNRKGKVESGVGHAQQKLAGLRFEIRNSKDPLPDRSPEKLDASELSLYAALAIDRVFAHA
jgi:transposase